MINFYNYLTDKKVSQSIYEMLFDKFMQSDEPTYTEYTGALPVTNNGNGNDLTDWVIYGNTGGVGDETANLFDNNGTIDLPDSLGQRYGVYLPDGTYSIYNDTDNSIYRGTNNFRNRSVVCNPHSTATYTLDNSATPNTTAGFYMGTTTSDHIGCTIVEGSTPPTGYIPYGYKIPILSASETTNIYIDSPLGLNETVSKSDTNINIPTNNGTTTISCDTVVQPEKIYIKYIGG